MQVGNRLVMSYQINATSDAAESVLTGTCSEALDADQQCPGSYINAAFHKVGSVAKITLDKTTVKRFCSPGNALMRAFQVGNTAGLLAGTSTLDIQLHANAGPFYLKNTLEVVSRSPVLKHIQNVVYDAGELSLTFPGPPLL